MELKIYPKYVDSAIADIGLVPENWAVLPLKRILQIRITDGPHETPELVDNGIPFISAEAIKNGKVNFNLKRGYITREVHELYCKKCKPKKGDIFMVKSGATTGSTAIVETDKEFNIWSPLALIRCDIQKALSKYMYYFISSKSFRQQVEIGWSYGTQQNIGMGVIENLYVVVPPMLVQEEIVTFLDKKTSEIDSLIADKEKLIELLEEKRQAIITEAVTKGLNPKVEMKDSGVEWIGEIPEHWEVTKLKYLVTLRTEKVVDDNKLVYVGLENIESKTGKYIGNPDDINFIEGTSNIFYSGDVLFGKLRPYLAKCVLLDFNGKCTTEALVLKAKRDLMSKEYLKSLLLSQKIIDVVNSSTYGAKMPRASWEFISNLRIPVPSIEEQREIEGNIDIKLQEVDTLKSKLTEQIKKLKEYRQSLIYEAVTGKIDVREYSKSLS